MKTFAAAGFDANQTIKATPAILNLATAGELELAQAAELVAKVLLNQGKSIEEVGNVTDIISKGAALSATSIENIGPALSFVGGTGKMAGLTQENLTAGIAVLAGKGIDSTRAGRGLRTMLTALLDASDKAAALLKEYGLTVSDAQGRMLPLDQLVAKFQANLGHLSQVQRAGVLGGIFSQEGME
jgi:TP901 family phage tail tape measure protein